MFKKKFPIFHQWFFFRKFTVCEYQNGTKRWVNFDLISEPFITSLLSKLTSYWNIILPTYSWYHLWWKLVLWFYGEISLNKYIILVISTLLYKYFKWNISCILSNSQIAMFWFQTATFHGLKELLWTSPIYYRWIQPPQPYQQPVPSPLWRGTSHTSQTSQTYRPVKPNHQPKT